MSEKESTHNTKKTKKKQRSARSNVGVKHVNSHEFYDEYHGHRLDHLTIIHDELRKGEDEKGQRNVVWLAGDSSLDPKFWFTNEAAACNGYEDVLRPPRSRQDIAYHLNHFFVEGGHGDTVCINTAIEESTIGARSSALLPQDEFIRDHLQGGDTIVLSVGGNDVALRPSFGTVVNMLAMTWFNSTEKIAKGPEFAWGMNHFIRLFKRDVQSIVERMTQKVKPSKVIICMIYYPDETPSGGWADGVLSRLGYRKEPEKLQTAIRQLFKYATCQIELDGIEVIPFALYDVLDGKDTSSYVAGVEPSAKGCRQIAQALLPHIV